MHSKTKGNSGQFAIALVLSKLGFSVFTEEGDISKIDLIAEKNGILLRIQCKAITPINNTLKLYLIKSGPSYKFRYQKSMFDYFGIYDLVNDKVYFVPSSILDKNKTQFCIRYKKPKHGKLINNSEDFLPERVLRDYTNNTLTDNTEGNDIVQTTTEMARET